MSIKIMKKKREGRANLWSSDMQQQICGAPPNLLKEKKNAHSQDLKY